MRPPPSSTRLIPILLLFAGLWLTFGQVVLSRFAVIPTGPTDVRLIGYLLEHGYLWVSGDHLHRDFWNAPFFYPLRNVTALSETFLGAAPLYWLPRVLGLDANVSLDVWLIAQMVLNFWVFASFLRVSLRMSWSAASVGAYLFTFSAIRLHQIGHAQLLPQFYTVLALQGLWMLLRNTAPVAGLAVLVATTVLQLYAGFYLGWFWILAAFVALLLAAIRSSDRRHLIAAARSLAPGQALVVAALGAAALVPLASHYLDAARAVGLRDFSEVTAMIPRWRSWLNVGPGHPLYGWWFAPLIGGRFELEWEHRLGLGLITPIAAMVGVWIARREPWAPAMFGTTLILFLIATRVGSFMAWKVVYDWFPAGGSIRAVSRIAVLFLIPASIAVAYVVERLVAGRRLMAAAAIIVVVVAEQHTPLAYYPYEPIVARENALAGKVAPTCRAFLYTPSTTCAPDEAWATRHGRAVDSHLDAMVTSNDLGIPTLNGYSGSLPRQYPFWGLDYCGPQDQARIEQMIREWCGGNGCRASSVCWVH